MNKEDKIINEEELTDTKELNELLDANNLDVMTNAIQEYDNDKFKELVAAFNQNMMKKNMLRTMKYSDLMDKLGDKALEKLDSPDLSDKNIIGYMNAIQKALDSSNKAMTTLPENGTITFNTQNNNINITEDALPRESRERVLDYVDKILRASNNNENGENK